MAIKTKKLTIEGEQYLITQHPATEGCLLIEKYHNAVRAFILNQETALWENKELFPLIPVQAVFVDGRMLAVLMFFDKLANPDVPYEMYKQPNQPSEKLSLKELLEGKTLEERPPVERIRTPMSYLINYGATIEQDMSLDYAEALDMFLKYVTFDGVPLDYDSLSYTTIHALLVEVINFNFLNVWTKKRWSLPEGYSAGGVQAPRSLERVSENFGQSNIIYTILKSELDLASLSDLALHMSVEDAYDANEAAHRDYYERAEMQKEAERQAKNNQQ
ncbi:MULTISPECIES: hypothetical protein [unclassified Pseudomonas]|uniref:hypothetical protein n=1 Tax=unclassified Pseudomonas TaxID=196821 RepID=UPI000871A4EB|nr:MULTISPECIES: hypothetical protein [unclassified Pseudomonas]SCW76391.1 hypothetical protein SAMN03159424_03019 [Pseudomonas sp. NFACC05-1]SEI69843.1 hypothetical protein SAMN03159298_01099 [Pseudomonas sp. NFACC07-1]